MLGSLMKIPREMPQRWLVARGSIIQPLDSLGFDVDRFVAVFSEAGDQEKRLGGDFQLLSFE